MSSVLMSEAPAIAAPASVSTSGPRGFLPHVFACISGAAIDNLFRQVGMAVIAIAAIASHPNNADQAAAASASYNSWALMLFSLPFIILAPLAGSLGDRIAKHHIIRLTRIADLPIIALGIYGYVITSPTLMLVALTLLGITSAFFAPTKLAVIPELVSDKFLSKANAIIAAVTVLAILGGTILAASIDVEWVTKLAAMVGIEVTANTPLILMSSIALIICAVGITSAFLMPALAPQAPHAPLAMPWHVVRQVKVLNRNPGTWTPALALGGFWALGGAAFAGLSTLATMVYGLSEAGTVGCYLALVVGMIIGSALAPLLMARPFPAGAPILGVLIAGGAFTMVGFTAVADATLMQELRSPHTMLMWLTVTGIGAGLWEVPVTVLLQERAAPQQRNLVMAAVTIIGSFGTFAAAGFFKVLVDLGLTPAESLILCGGIAFFGGLLAFISLRKQIAGWLLTLMVKLAYRVRVVAHDGFPETGGCLVICNHLSYSDGIILASHLPRPGRFLVYRRFVDMPVIGLFMRAAGVIPVAAEDSRRALLASIDVAIEAAKAGEVVVIFPEGKLTRSGQMDVFRSGLERIATRAGVPIIPAHLDGLWGTVTSRAEHKAWLRPRRPVTLRIGSPLPSSTPAAQARAAVMTLSYETAQAKAEADKRTLGSAVITSMRRHPFRPAVRDAGGVLSYWQLVGIARAVIPALSLASDEERVGVLLPPGRAGTIVNLALALAGKTAVNLNHTVGSTQLQRMCELANIRTVISSDLYMRRIGDISLSQRLITAEKILPTISKFSILLQAIEAFILPVSLITDAKPDMVATIIFSSGSTGDPKGVELTHRQVLANVTSVSEGLELKSDRDVLLSPLPLFHSFGLVPGCWLGLVLGLPVASQPDPTDAKALGALAQTSGATFLLSTPTFVRGYMRRIEPEQFKTLRFAVVGAERCPADLKVAFKERYGSELLEGYGCTELAPVVAVNLLTIKRDGLQEIRSRDGTVGRPLPGIDVIAVDPETFEPLSAGSEGLLVVRSASRMRGYLNRDDLTEKAFMHNGYNTGDMGHVDAEGFVHITGRLARFAKIGGEMVPLDNVEIAVQTAVIASTADANIEIAVAAVHDSSRGERLLVMHTGFNGDWSSLLDSLADLPPLWKPKARDVHHVESIPKLGTGKRDLAGLKQLAANLATK